MFDHFASALDAAAAIRAKQISSVELTELMLRRIDAHQPALNSYVYILREQALAAAHQADDALARNQPIGPLHGVPISVKESFGVAGQPCTWGIPAFRNARSPHNATAVQRLLDAGAILLGATNVPETLMDMQSFNDIYGVSNNPWDLSRSPGGSSGGSAASLAAGLAFLSIGSDIGGSIRSPASVCGVYGHKPTIDIVPMTGHLPGGMLEPPGFTSHMAVAGPMARTAADLDAALHILAGPEKPASKAFAFTLPPPRHNALRDFRIGFVLEDPETPVSAETKAVLEAAAKACERAGATLKPGWPSNISFAATLDTYYFHLGAFDFSMQPPPAQEHSRRHMDSRPRTYAQGALSTFAEWQQMNMRRLGLRARWEAYFQEVDVFLSPTTFTAAFPHDPTPIDHRRLTLPEGRQQPFWDMVNYICPASLTGCPATTAPVGLTASGLPIGLQIMAPFLEDATSIAFARFLAQEIGGFQPPPGF